MSDSLPGSAVPEQPVDQDFDLEHTGPVTDSGNEHKSVWIPDGRSLREELVQPRYLGLLIIVLVVIVIQLWLLF